MTTPGVLMPMLIPFVTRSTRAYYAPVNRVTGAPTVFDPAVQWNWLVDAPTEPWVDLGRVTAFTRTAESKITELTAGAPATLQLQSRQSLGAAVGFQFDAWSKLSMALATSSQHMNLLAPSSSLPTVASGGKAAPAVALQANSSASVLYLPPSSGMALTIGSMVVVDDDYAGQTGFVGAGVAGSWVRDPALIQNEPDYVRRVSINVGRVVAIGLDGGVQLATPLLAGTPSATMKVQQIVGFVDREGGLFFHEWSALFVTEGSQGETLFHYYPRLQACQGATEASTPLGSLLEVKSPAAKFRALPVIDGSDGSHVVCYRSFIPGPANRI